MAGDFSLELTGVSPFRTIGGVPHAIWTYTLSWAKGASVLVLIGLGGGDKTTAPRLGLEVSLEVEIQDPGKFTDVPEIQATKLERPTQGDVQHLYREFQSPPSSPVAFSFIAPARQDSFFPIRLVHRETDDAAWAKLAFKAADGEVAHQQIMSGPAVVTEQPAQQPAAAVLDGAARHLDKATLVPLMVEDNATRDVGAIVKFGYVRQLALQPGEVQAVQDRLGSGGDVQPKKRHLRSDAAPWSLLKSFEGSPLPATLPPPSALAGLPAASLIAFGQTLAALRTEALEQHNSSPRTRTARGVALVAEQDVGTQQHLLNLALVATKSFELNATDSRIGMLNLERLEMSPAGIERGELLATIPLAPGEKTAVVQKEWSVTTKEFTSIVTDSLENLSETGVTDNTELAQSSSSQIQHANQFNITGTVSGGIPLISGSATSSFGAQDSASQSATDSRKHAVTVTEKAASRTKKEHKVTISTTTVTGTSESTTRELVNSSLTDPIRIDYFSMMRKWRVRLYRYGLRLTYDIVIPEPAGALRRAYADLDSLRQKIKPFEFTVTHDEIRPDNNHYLELADMYQASVASPPGPGPTLWPGGEVPGLSDGVHFFRLDFEIPPGYRVKSVTLDATVTKLPGKNNDFAVLGTTFFENQGDKTFPSTLLISKKDGRNFMEHAVGRQGVTFYFNDANRAMVLLTIETEPTPESVQQWQADTWTALYNAAQAQYYARQQDLAGQIAQLEEQLNNVDTLTLRREESNEIMKGVLRFLLGPDFDFMPQSVIDAIEASGGDVVPEYGVGFTGNSLGLSAWDLTVVRQHEDKVRFINQAIEWENVVSFLYSYFWDIPDSWDFIRQIKHPDANRQAFLRAGAARVILTVRKGWEEAWVRFAEGGFEGAALDPDHPYLTIAQEIAAYDDRNYPGIPPANPAQQATRLQDAVYTTSSATLAPSAQEVEIEVQSSVGFLVGAQVVIDARVDTDKSTDFGRQEAQLITRIRDDKHITVQRLEHPHGGNGAFPIIQPGEKGALLAEWYEYTPTSGTDIAMTSNLAAIA